MRCRAIPVALLVLMVKSSDEFVVAILGLGKRFVEICGMTFV